MVDFFGQSQSKDLQPLLETLPCSENTPRNFVRSPDSETFHCLSNPMSVVVINNDDVVLSGGEAMRYACMHIKIITLLTCPKISTLQVRPLKATPSANIGLKSSAITLSKNFFCAAGLKSSGNNILMSMLSSLYLNHGGSEKLTNDAGTSDFAPGLLCAGNPS